MLVASWHTTQKTCVQSCDVETDNHLCNDVIIRMPRLCWICLLDVGIRQNAKNPKISKSQPTAQHECGIGIGTGAEIGTGTSIGIGTVVATMTRTGTGAMIVTRFGIDHGCGLIK